MKKINFLMAFLFFCSIVKSQNPVYADALYLRDNTDQYLNKIILKRNIEELLQKYYPNGTTINEALLNTNPYLKDLFTANGANSAADIGASNFLSAIPSLDITTVADGIARFLVKRTKEELSIAFFEKFKAALDDPANADMRGVFPLTYKSLSVIDKEVYNFNAYILTLREAFLNDLEALPDNLDVIIANHSVFFSAHPEIEAALKSGFYLCETIKQGIHPGQIIEDFPVSYWTTAGINANFVPAFRTIQLLSTSFKDPNSTGNYWMSGTQVNKLFSDDMLLKLYMGLLSLEAAKGPAIVFTFASGSTPDFSAILTGNAANIAGYKRFLSSFISKSKSIESKIKDFETTSNDSLRFEKYHTFITSGIDLMRFTISNQELLGVKKADVNLIDITKTYFETAQSLSDIAIAVNRRKYSSAIVLFSDLLDKQLPGENVNTKAIFKYGSFMTAVAAAKKPKEVEDAIEAFALPTGSSRIKRETIFNVSVNAYCGLFYGGENIRGLDKGYKGTFGVTAPIGVAISFGSQHFIPYSSLKKHNGTWASTIFLSVVDIGAVTAFRFEDDTTESAPKIELKDVISPGIFYSFGIPKCPLSVNLGYQVGPLLRKVKATANTYQESYSRISVSVVVDIPLLNLYTKSK